MWTMMDERGLFRNYTDDDNHRNHSRAELLRAARLGLIVAMMIALVSYSTACSSSDNASELGASGLFRTPRPTFTPTAVATDPLPQSTPDIGAQAQPQPDQQPAAPADSLLDDPPRAVVNAPLVNVRDQPNLDSNVLATVERGAEYDIVGRSANGDWWQVCCVDAQPVWVARQLVDTDGAVDAVLASDTNQPLAAESSSASSPGQGGGALTNARFELVAQEQFPEASLVRIYLYVYEEPRALAGYSLRITKDGREIPVSAKSFGGQPAFTWPLQDARQRYQNFKIELTNEPPQGQWVLQLVDSQGSAVGPPAEFSLAPNDPNQELYVRYERID